MSFSSESVYWFPIVNHIREALTDYYTTWQNEGRIQLSETPLEGDPYSTSRDGLVKTVVEFKVTNWDYKMPNRWRGLNCEDEMTDSLSAERVKYTTKIDFLETSEADGTHSYTYTVTCTPDPNQAYKSDSE